MLVIAYIFLGIVAGIASGLLGIGGGIFIVPLLVHIFYWQDLVFEDVMHIATATSLATMMMTTLISTITHNTKKSVHWRLLYYLVPGTMLGAFLGVSLASVLPSVALRILFAVTCIVIACRMFLTDLNNCQANNHPDLSIKITLIGIVIGAFSGMLGIGGGILLVPLLVRMRFSMVDASATSAACTFPTVSVGAISAIIVGWDEVGLVNHFLGFVYWRAMILIWLGCFIGSIFGSQLAHILPKKILKRLFGMILLVMAGSIFISYS